MNTSKVNLWVIDGHNNSAMARYYSKLPPSRNPQYPHDFVWVPLSIIEHTSRNVGGHHVVTLPSWFVLERGL